MDSEPLVPPRRVLHSWKDIAIYVGRGVRTIQRYEAQFDFPVHRPAGVPRSSVLAFADEIDGWLAQSSLRDGKDKRGCPKTVADFTPKIESLQERAKLSMQRISATRARVERTMTYSSA